MVSLALVLGVVGQMLSVRTGFPNIVFFLIFGVLVGPEFLSLVHPSEFADKISNSIFAQCAGFSLSGHNCQYAFTNFDKHKT